LISIITRWTDATAMTNSKIAQCAQPHILHKLWIHANKVIKTEAFYHAIFTVKVFFQMFLNWQKTQTMAAILHEMCRYQHLMMLCRFMSHNEIDTLQWIWYWGWRSEICIAISDQIAWSSEPRFI
jgi:hypothetical protein